MASGSDAQNELDRRTIRTMFAIFLVVAVVAIMVFGIKMIGESEHISTGGLGYYTHHDQAQLQFGIFITLLSALALVGSVKAVVAVWKRKGV